jgi:predicted DNA-binding transcriptional regulator AlpA
MSKCDIRSLFRQLDDDLLLTPDEVAELTSMTRGAVYQSLHRGQMPEPVQRQRGRLRWSVGQMREFLAGLRTQSVQRKGRSRIQTV